MDICTSSKNPPQPQNQSPNQIIETTSSSSDHLLHAEKKKEEEVSNPARKSCMKLNTKTKYLGVRQRPSGRWVAEIKDSCQKLRLWLGTFDRPEDAAMAYDDAARLLRGRNAKTNFPPPNQIQRKSTTSFSKNSRFYQLLHHALIKNQAKLQANSIPRPHDERCVSSDLGLYHVEETIVCSSSSDDHDRREDGFCGGGVFSLGVSSRVYSSVHVAPSFSASSCQREEEQVILKEKGSCDEESDGVVLVHENGF